MATQQPIPSQPFPLGQLLIIAFCRCSQPFAIASLLPYLPSYLIHLSIPATSIASYQGTLLATLGICESTSAIPWTRLADRIGRKPVLIGTLLAQMLGNLALGFCSSTWQLFACMVVIGVCNGNVAVMRTCVAEMDVQRQDQARAFSFTPMASAGGTLVGSLAGGWLARVRLGGGWPEFVLPSLASAAVFVPGIVFAALGLEETGQVKLGYDQLTHDTSSISEEERNSTSLELDEIEKDGLDLECQSDIVSEPDETTQRRFNIIRNPFIWLNALTAFHSIGFDNMLPVLLQMPSTSPVLIERDPPSLFHSAIQGFGADSRFTGVLFSTACLSAMIVSSVVYPRLARKRSHLDIIRWTTVIYPAIYLLLPLTLLPSNRTLSLGSLSAGFLIKGGVFVSALQASMILLTNSVEKDEVGLAHGMNFCLGGLGRGLGSAFVGWLFEVGFNLHAVVVPFWTLAVVSGGCCVLAFANR